MANLEHHSSAGLSEAGESPEVTGLVIKIASRCNLNCSYCYMYNMGDDSYKKQPKVMSNAVMDAMLHRIREHCLAHGIERFVLELHGGEPMLAGIPFFERLAQKASEILEPEVEPVILMQTNGVLITPEWCHVFARLGIGIGISLDGTQEENDRYRIDHAGRGSYHAIVDGLKTAQEHMGHSPGLLAVINLESDPIATYEHFLGLGAHEVNYLIPDVTYEQPLEPLQGWLKDSKTPVADWLIRLFDHWYGSKGQRLRISFFDQVIYGILGASHTTDTLGADANKVLVIETNGDIEAVDVLKICGQEFTKAGVNVTTHSLDEALATPLARTFYYSHKELPRQCRSCPVNEICGGGYLPHRYSKAQGFNNPSFYCQDLMKFITHVQNQLLEALPQEVLEETGLTKITFEEAKEMLAQNMAQDHAFQEYEDALSTF